jgi:hypothetical protein
LFSALKIAFQFRRKKQEMKVAEEWHMHCPDGSRVIKKSIYLSADAFEYTVGLPLVY